MAVYFGYEAVPTTLRGGVLTIGNFDGVHLGHQQLLAQAGLAAESVAVPVVAVTFEPHPMAIVAPHRAPRRLMPLEEKTRCLLRSGAHAVVVLQSTPALLSLEPEEFIRQVIVERLKPYGMVEGRSFGFGRGRRGDMNLLQHLGQQYGFQCHAIDPVQLQMAAGEMVLVSSSLIREQLRKGEVHRAQLCLGRPYALMGVVESGMGRGRALGFPTANLGQVDQLLPAHGVYAGEVELAGIRHLAGVSIGTNPTFKEQKLRIEAFVLDTSGDWVGQPMRINLWRYLRAQVKYDSAEALSRAISEDVQQIRQLARQMGRGG
ncbi:MAG: Riboflavin biosynthesis protein RibF [Phycisphaerae bacterium]|nr:Riboflavin biosynthesis protein RibF [Phycisphaerae bacterium]